MAKTISPSKAPSREAAAAPPADDGVIDAGAGPDTQANSGADSPDTPANRGADSPDTPVNVDGAQNGGAPSAELIAAITAAGGGLTPGTSSPSGFDGGASPQ
jgi:hypothetical protein